MPDPNTLASTLVFLVQTVNPKYNPVFIDSEDLNQHRYWLGLHNKNTRSLLINSASHISCKRELPEDRLTMVICFSLFHY